MERHEHLDAVGQALREVPQSVAWKGLEALSSLEVPVLIVGSQDDADTLHPLGVAEEYWRKLPNASWLWRTRASPRWPGRARGCRA